MDNPEEARLRALESYGVLDTAPEEAFDRLTELAADLFDAPMALVSLIDADRQWFKSRHGLDAESTPRSMAFCAHAIELAAGEAMVVPDATTDPRFRDNPLVTGPSNLRFYAGAVLTNADNYNLGALCVIDDKPRPPPSPADMRRLKALARMVMDELELRRASRIAQDKSRLLGMAERMSGVGHWLYRPAAGALEWSDELYRIHGQSRQGFDTANPAAAVELYQGRDRARLERAIERALTEGRGYELALRVRRHDGEVRDVVHKTDCLIDEGGKVEALFGVVRDVTEHRAAVRQLERGQVRLKQMAVRAEEQARRADVAEAVAGLGHWRLDVETNAITWSDQMYRIYGLTPGEPLDLDALMAQNHPDDQAANAARLERQRLHGEAVEDAITRVIRSDGEIRYLASKSQVERNADGVVVAVVGVVVDVTAQKAAEIALAASEQRFRRMAVNAPDMISESTLDGVMTYVSPACAAITGFTPEELIGRNVFTLMHPEDAAKVVRMCQVTFSSKGAIAPWPVEFRATHKEGHQIWLECKPTLALDPETGRFTGLTDVIRDVTPRKALEAQLRKAQAAAEAAAAVKGEFLANMSHELRTPLTSIVGFTRLASEQPELSELTCGYVERVGDASRALLCTVNDILDFSKLEAGQVSFQPQAIAPAKLGRATLDLFMPQAGAKDLTLTLEDGGGVRDLVVNLDPDRMRQILLNLVGNAVKFTDAGGVTLRGTYDAASAVLTVEVIDTGPGIAPEEQDLLFKRFSQVDGSLTRSHGGTGLGLAICKGLVEAMGGQIGADSRPGEGSRFWFKIPAPIARLPEASADDPAVDQLTFPGVRVLVVDDHAANRELARLFLSGVEAEVFEASDGEEAAEMAQAWPYDVILMDLRMPKLDGAAALRRIREAPGPNDSTPILAFSADVDAKLVEGLLAEGFQGVVPKPLEPGVLIAAVAQATAFADEGGDAEVADVA